MKTEYDMILEAYNRLSRKDRKRPHRYIANAIANHLTPALAFGADARLEKHSQLYILSLNFLETLGGDKS